jgi:hypothetical protein
MIRKDGPESGKKIVVEPQYNKVSLPTQLLEIALAAGG